MESQTASRWHNVAISASAAVLGLVLCLFLSLLSVTTINEATRYFVAMICTGTAFVLVSRFRNRSSFWWFVSASLSSNATWFLGVAALSSARAPMVFILLAVCAMVAGRTMGVKFATRIEQKHQLVANINCNPVQMKRFVQEARVGWTVMGLLLLVYTLILAGIDKEMGFVACVVVVLGFIQNQIYTQKSRLTQRGKNNPRTIAPVAVLGVAGGVVFFLSFAYLAHNKMSLALFVPYTLTTVLGATYGMWQSMRRELRMMVGGDDHLPAKDTSPVRVQIDKRVWTETERRVYLFLLLIGVAWMLVYGPIASALNLTITPLVFPLSEDMQGVPRLITLLVTACILFTQEISHTLVQSSGNRDHVGYHVASIVLWSALGFLVTRTILKNPTWDIVPIAVVGSTLGLMYGRTISARIESRLMARMDNV